MKLVKTDATLFTGTVKYVINVLVDVMFHVDVVNGVVDFDTIRVSPADANYFKSLNQVRWLKEARDYIVKGGTFKVDGSFNSLVDDQSVWATIDDGCY